MTEMRKRLLETSGKAIHVIRWQGTWLKCVYVPVFWGRQNKSHPKGQLVESIAEQCAHGVPAEWQGLGSRI